MKLIFVGPQGSGKGTQGKILSKKFGLAHISMGDLLRNAKGERKEKINQFINQGELVPIDLTIELISERIKDKDCENGFIFDGFPRTIEQAKELDKIVKIDKAIEISITDELGVKRLANRWSCKGCGEPYNAITKKPDVEGKCNKCGGELYQREDDKPEAIKKRLEIYHKETEPILKHYDSVKVDGGQEIDDVTKDILKILK
ncbi:nucleoside monophosphate kinase [Candidatus Pacearchaeota archaeon]|nr:nucleoside monophosphate kinase [Candidatus Pacearchaeota archaeon]